MRLLRKSQVPDFPVSPYRYARSWHGITFHLVDTRESDTLALCGYEVLDLKSTVSPGAYLAGYGFEHEGLRYCRDCGAAVSERVS